MRLHKVCLFCPGMAIINKMSIKMDRLVWIGLSLLYIEASSATVDARCIMKFSSEFSSAMKMASTGWKDVQQRVNRNSPIEDKSRFNDVIWQQHTEKFQSDFHPVSFIFISHHWVVAPCVKFLLEVVAIVKVESETSNFAIFHCTELGNLMCFRGLYFVYSRIYHEMWTGNVITFPEIFRQNIRPHSTQNIFRNTLFGVLIRT